VQDGDRVIELGDSGDYFYVVDRYAVLSARARVAQHGGGGDSGYLSPVWSGSQIVELD